MFSEKSFGELINANPENLDETNENELNVRIVNIVNQIRTENKGIHQPLKFLFVKYLFC